MQLFALVGGVVDVREDEVADSSVDGLDSSLLCRKGFHSYRDLKDPDGWRRSSFKKILLRMRKFCKLSELWKRPRDRTYHPAALERAADSIKGVSIQGFRAGVA